MNDWMDRIDEASAEKARDERLRHEGENTAEDLVRRLAPLFATSVLAKIDEDVNRWNDRPSSAKIASVDGTPTSRRFRFGDRTLNVRYSDDLRMLDVDIEVGNETYVAPNIVADSYVLSVDNGDIIATRHGTSRRGSLSSPEQISEEILTTLLS